MSEQYELARAVRLLKDVWDAFNLLAVSKDPAVRERATYEITLKLHHFLLPYWDLEAGRSSEFKREVKDVE